MTPQFVGQQSHVPSVPAPRMDINSNQLGTADRSSVARREVAAVSDTERASQRTRQTLDAPGRVRIAVEWHAASLSYIHRILDPRTGRQIQQVPAAQVLDMVDDLMRQIEKG